MSREPGLPTRDVKRMADLPPYPNIDADDDTSLGPGSGAPASRPRWVSALVIIGAIVLGLLFVLLHLTGAVGPGAHS